jgi:hypothetical protein
MDLDITEMTLCGLRADVKWIKLAKIFFYLNTYLKK